MKLNLIELMEVVNVNEPISFTITKTKDGIDSFKYECTSNDQLLFTALFLGYLNSEIIHNKQFQEIIEEYTPFGADKPLPAIMYSGLLSTLYSACSQKLLKQLNKLEK